MSEKTDAATKPGPAPTQPVKKPTIWEAIPMITGKCAPIGKTRENKSQGYSFRGIDDVYAVLNLLFAEYGVSALPEILTSAHDQAGTTSKGNAMWRHMVKVRYWLTDSYGARVAADAEGEGQDSGDKSIGKAQSVAFKAMCFQVFCIPTGEKIAPNLDAEDDDPAVGAETTTAATKPAEPAKPLDASQALCTMLAGRMKLAKDGKDLAVAQADYLALAMEKQITEKQVDWLEGIMKKQLERIGKEGK